MSITLESACELHPQVALRPEEFGALAYHYGNRRLIFLKHPDVVAVVKTLGEHDSLASAFTAQGIETNRWPSFLAALNQLETSEIVRAR